MNLKCFLLMLFFTLTSLASIEPAKAENSEGRLAVTVEEAVLMALKNNQSLIVERTRPGILRTVIEEEKAPFDPVVDATVSLGKTRVMEADSKTLSGRISLEKLFSAGTSVGGEFSSDSNFDDNDSSTSRLGVYLNQPLLQGRGEDVGLARLRLANLDAGISEFELQGFVETLVANVETACWDYAVSHRRIEIVEESMKLVEQQYADTKAMISVGKTAEAELTAVQAEVALQKQGVINAVSALRTQRLNLLNLIIDPQKNSWNSELTLLVEPSTPEVKLEDVDVHVKSALEKRPELKQAQLGVEKGDIEIVRTKNGLLPRMDLFLKLGKSGYSDSFGGSIGDMNEESYDAMVGVSLQYPLEKRADKASNMRAGLQRDQAEKALENLKRLIELDVRAAYIEVNRARDQIEASAATKRLQEEKLRTETEKFKVGRSTSFMVSQAQRDLLESRIGEVEAVATYLKSLINFYRLEGSLLERRGISWKSEQ